MSHKRTYLDYNAGAPLLSEAKEAMLAALETSANPSSVHGDGRNARRVIEQARKKVGELAGVGADHVIFTSGATEAAQLALSPVYHGPNGEIECEALYVSAVEHPCILSGGRFAAPQIIPVTSEGVVDIAAFAEMLSKCSSKKPFLTALMLANNETGIIQPVAEMAELVHEKGGYLLVDAVQAAGRVPVDMKTLGADFLILTSHKIGGPQGVGALILRDKNLKPTALICGGGQESQLRPGTENVAAIAGFGAAAQLCIPRLDHMQNMIYVRDEFEDQLSDICKLVGNSHGPVVIFGQSNERLANTTCFAVKGINAETALISLDLDGISVSSGSACSSGRVEHSHVLKAMGYDSKFARAAIRVSCGLETSPDERKKFLEAWASYLKRLS